MYGDSAETVSVTLADYGDDYTALMQYPRLINKIEKHVAAMYVKAICEKRMSFRNYEDRKNAAEQILADTEKVRAVHIDIVYMYRVRSCNNLHGASLNL